ncbi:MAG: hypothetical protein R2851_14420 [Caldilineaceae bacterium]
MARTQCARLRRVSGPGRLQVIMLERRHTVGGAVVTEEIVPGFKFDLGGSAHILIHHTPVVQDLNLAAYGLEYIDVDPLFWAPFPDGSHITIWQDLIARVRASRPSRPRMRRTTAPSSSGGNSMAHGMVASFWTLPRPAIWCAT